MTVGNFYSLCLVVGVAYALVSGILNWIVGHGDGADVHMDAAGHLDPGHMSPVSGTVIATFVTGFGAGGTIAHYGLEWSLVPGMATAMFSGLSLGAVVFGVLEFIFARTQAGSEYDADDLTGRQAEVITPIGEGIAGEITYVVKGQRERASARTSNGQAIGKGSLVVIESMVGSTAYVRSPDQGLSEDRVSKE